MFRHFQLLTWSMVALMVLAASLSNAQTTTATTVPRLVHFAAVASDVNGKPLSGIIGVSFALYAEQTGGASLWLETQNVVADAKGNYSVELGAASADGLPMDVFATGQARWLGVQISGQAEQPRVLLLAVPYALKAADAETIGGLPPSAFMRATQASGAQANGAGRVDPQATTSKTVKTNSPYGTANYLPLWTSASTIQNSNVFQSAAGDVGVGTATPGATLDVNGTGNFSGLVTFASGQTFPGTGTITGVTAGTDLTGGGTSGNVTLNLNTTALNSTYAQLAAANTFTGNQTVNGNLSATGLVSGSGFEIGSNLFDYGSYANGNAFLGFAGNTTTTAFNTTAVGYQASLTMPADVKCF